MIEAASGNTRVLPVTTEYFFPCRENHEPERLGLNGIAETTVAMEVT